MAVADRAALLAGYLNEAAAKRFDWRGQAGGHDCCQFIRHWLWRVLGRDPVAGRRLSYSSELGAALLVHRHGGMIPFLDDMLGGAGLVRAAPGGPWTAGDVGAIEAETAHGRAAVAAIAMQHRWACVTTAGLLVRQTAPLALWRLPEAG